MEAKANISLKNYNSFGIEVKAEKFFEVFSEDDLFHLIENNIFKEKFLILGGGNNMLFINDLHCNVIKNCIKGKKNYPFGTEIVKIEVGSSEKWTNFVDYCADNNYYGVENLAYIPAEIGGTVVQNIGAYGAEIGDVIDSVEAVDIETGKKHHFNKLDCDFSYRNSIFKKLRNKFFITKVIFELSIIPKINRSYKQVDDILKKIENPTAKQIAEIITKIRQDKLPEVGELGSAGSFFKNPVVGEDVYQNLLSQYAEIENSSFDIPDSSDKKISAAFLIEKCGWKGYREGDAGVYMKHSLILVNYGKASGQEILELAMKIQHSVKDKFNIDLEMEVIVND